MDKIVADLNRRPPREVLKALRQEVGFCCPVDSCGNPYLTWHHFDPEWRVEHHHRTEGMIALCRIHADQADNDAFTKEQLRKLKRSGHQQAQKVRGRFNWMRRDLLIVVGGSFFYELSTVLQINDIKCIWFDRDENNNLLLNVRLPSLDKNNRTVIEDNAWMTLPNVEEIICPPNGRIVHIKYNNGDYFRAEFFTISSASKLLKRYPKRGVEKWVDQITFPITGIELSATISGTSLHFSPKHTQLGGIDVTNAFVSRIQGSAMSIAFSEADFKRLFDTDVFAT